MNEKNHITVMLHEAVDFLQVQPGAWYVDSTFGRGGHTALILEKGGKVVAFDFDQESVQTGQARFAQPIAEKKLILVRENFDQMAEVLRHLRETEKIEEISGILFDFGTSTNQLMSEERGFSFSNENASLDMRMDDRLGVKASDLLKVLTEKELTQIFREFGGEAKAAKIAKIIGKLREENPKQLETVGALIKAVSLSQRHQKGHLHPATKVFQALRIVVNDEISNIEKVLPQALELVKPGGRIVSIAFHEGEDRLVKHAFAAWEHHQHGIRITPKALKPSEEELAKNPRSRSAKMRVFERNA